MKFRAKYAEIDAEQFTDYFKPCRGVTVDSAGAKGFLAHVTTIHGQKTIVVPGDWIVQEPENPERFYPVQDSTFQKRWEAIP